MDIRISFPGGVRVDAELEGEGRVVHTDQSKLSGGEGSAPEPYQLFLVSIGTCAGLYVLRFCQERDLSTDGIELVQRQEYDESGRRLAKVSLSIKVPAGFPAKYRQALVRAAGLCAVKKAIADPPEFQITVNEE
jgi:putative redox protein